MSTSARVVAAVALAALGSALASAWPSGAPGDLDAGFDGDGKRTIDYGGADSGQAVALQPDGRILVAGYGDPDTAMTVTRLHPDGSLDLSFGDGGTGSVNFFGRDFAYAVAVQPDGKVVLVGETRAVAAAANIAVARLDPDGTPDLGFDVNGIRVIDLLGDDRGQAVALQPDGKILVAGFGGAFGNAITVTRLNPDGTDRRGLRRRRHRRRQPRRPRAGLRGGAAAGRQDRHRRRPIPARRRRPGRPRRPTHRRRLARPGLRGQRVAGHRLRRRGRRDGRDAAARRQDRPRRLRGPRLGVCGHAPEPERLRRRQLRRRRHQPPRLRGRQRGRRAGPPAGRQDRRRGLHGRRELRDRPSPARRLARHDLRPRRAADRGLRRCRSRQGARARSQRADRSSRGRRTSATTSRSRAWRAATRPPEGSAAPAPASRPAAERCHGARARGRRSSAPRAATSCAGPGAPT